MVLYRPLPAPKGQETNPVSAITFWLPLANQSNTDHWRREASKEANSLMDQFSRLNITRGITCDLPRKKGDNLVPFYVWYEYATLPDIMYWAKRLAELSDKTVCFTAERIEVRVSPKTDLEALLQLFQMALWQGGSEIGPAED
jgi:hypothetical protein